MDPIEWQINHVMDAMNRIPHATAAAKRTNAQDDPAMVNPVAKAAEAKPMRQDQDLDDGGNSDDKAVIEGEEFSETSRKEAESLIDELKTNFIRTVTDKADEHDRKVIWTLMSYETAENSRKAFVYLWKQQNAWTAPYPNPAPNPRNDIKL
ncbi:hypothetical protein BGZ51_006096 [Haplosporangium sp. Z 767]|nr:hypothetical protein BGZ51_006096 [Haplosporangium sp. Z 767]KAF9180796.1 hypothetical protein BGZ50_005908 [Haplosporangium sp. Z 11]